MVCCLCGILESGGSNRHLFRAGGLGSLCQSIALERCIGRPQVLSHVELVGNGDIHTTALGESWYRGPWSRDSLLIETKLCFPFMYMK